jgi:hypothetical protein
MSTKERGGKLGKTPSFEKPSLAVTVRFEMEVA